MAIITKTNYQRLKNRLRILSFRSKGNITERRQFNSVLRQLKSSVPRGNTLPSRFRVSNSLLGRINRTFSALTQGGGRVSGLGKTSESRNPTKAYIARLVDKARTRTTVAKLRSKLSTARAGYSGYSTSRIGKGIVYRITEKGTGRTYVGQTMRDLGRRVYEHFNNTGNVKNPSRFDKLARTSNIKNFRVKVLATTTSRVKLDKLESTYIKKYASSGKSLNTSTGRRPLSLKNITRTRITKVTRKR